MASSRCLGLGFVPGPGHFGRAGKKDPKLAQESLAAARKTAIMDMLSLSPARRFD